MGEDELDVRMGNISVGTLFRTRKGARFVYSPEAQDRYLGSPLLSVSLPVKKRPYSEGLTRSWFAGLLPEGEMLDQLCASIGCSPYDYFGILRQVGFECVGAVCVCPRDSRTADYVRPNPICDEELIQILNELSEHTLTHAARTSLAGVQDKIALAATEVKVDAGWVKSAHWATPSPTVISTHIVKPQPNMAYPGLIEGEAWAMEVARSAARCASSALIDLEEAPASLVVRRFDRTIVDGTVKRVHQEDCCQALGLPPTNKYADAVRQKGDDPTYARIAAILAQYADDPLAEADELLRQIVVNLALGNVDAHAKNYSLLHVQPAVAELSPMYDVVPVRDIEPRARHLSIRIMGKILADDITREDVIGEACSWGMGRGRAIQVIDETLSHIEVGIAQANAPYPMAGQRHTAPTYERLRQLA